MDGFSVDLHELGDAVATLDKLGQELRAGSTLSYWMQPSEVGDQPLSDVLADLKDATTRAAELLEMNSSATSARLAETGRAYIALDEKHASVLNGFDGAARERPGRHD